MYSASLQDEPLIEQLLLAGSAWNIECHLVYEEALVVFVKEAPFSAK